MTALLILLALVGGIWSAVFVLRGSLSQGCLLFLFTIACLGLRTVNLGLGAFELGHAVLAILLIAYFVQQQRGLTANLPMTAADWSLLAFLALITITTFDQPSVGFTPPMMMLPHFRWAVGWMTPAMLYWIARQSVWSERQTKMLLATMTLFGVYLSVTGVLEILRVTPLIWPAYIGDPSIDTHFGRARGPLLDSVASGFMTSVCLVGAWLLWPRLSSLGRMCLAALTPIFLAALYFTYTRSIWIGALSALTILLSVQLPRHWRGWFVAASVMAAMLGGLVLKSDLEGFKRDTSSEGTRVSAALRPPVAYVSWLMFQDHPILGCGLGRYSFDKNDYLSDRSSDLRLEMARGMMHHNLFLSILVDTGLVGFSLIMFVLWRWTRDAWRLWSDVAAPAWARTLALLYLCVLAIFVSNAMFHDVSHTKLCHMIFFTVAGCCSAAVGQWRSMVAAPKPIFLDVAVQGHRQPPRNAVGRT